MSISDSRFVYSVVIRFRSGNPVNRHTGNGLKNRCRRFSERPLNGTIFNDENVSRLQFDIFQSGWSPELTEVQLVPPLTLLYTPAFPPA